MGDTREEHDRRYSWHQMARYQGGDGQIFLHCYAPGCGFDTAREAGIG